MNISEIATVCAHVGWGYANIIVIFLSQPSKHTFYDYTIEQLVPAITTKLISVIKHRVSVSHPSR